MARVRISKTPKALSGLEVKMRPGLYGTNGNRQFTLPNQVNSQRFSQQPVDVRDTLQPVAREGANLEAEKGETALVNIDGVPAHFKIGGKRHSKGGTPLNLPDNSFIFSDTAKMKIKDPILIAQFGMVPKKSGYTPAEIAKRYDINTFRKILADPNSEDVERKTAEMMISNYNMKLAKLALVQESTKGFPQGIPAVAMPYIMANEINPEELFETQGQEEQPDADMGVSRYGGNMVSQFPTKQYGGLPTAQEGNTVLNKYKNAYTEVPTKPWIGGDGKLHNTDIRFEPFKLSETPSYFGFPFIGDGVGDYLSEMRGPIKNVFDPVEEITESEAIKKLNPYNAEGVIDYGMNLMNMPLYLMNSGIGSGKMETTGNIFTDVAMDPLTYFGLAPVEWAAKAAVKYGPKAAAFVAKHGKKAVELLGQYGDIAVEAIKKYGKEGIDYVIKNVHKLVPSKEAARNIAGSFLSRGITGAGQELDKNKEIKKLEEEVDLYKNLYENPGAALPPTTSVLQPKKKKITINTSKEYYDSLAQPYSKEKRDAQIEWNKANPEKTKTIEPIEEDYEQTFNY
jgi:hypothetical protein